MFTSLDAVILTRPPARRRRPAGAMAAFSAPLVGLLAEDWFGFKGSSKVTGDRATDLHNAQALGSALLAFTTGRRTARAALKAGCYTQFVTRRCQGLLGCLLAVMSLSTCAGCCPCSALGLLLPGVQRAARHLPSRPPAGRGARAIARPPRV
jgi:hypothetical protein